MTIMREVVKGEDSPGEKEKTREEKIITREE